MSYRSEESIQIGEFHIAPSIDEGKIWIFHGNGEGGDFPIEDVEKLLRAYYDENF